MKSIFMSDAAFLLMNRERIYYMSFIKIAIRWPLSQSRRGWIVLCVKVGKKGANSVRNCITAIFHIFSITIYNIQNMMQFYLFYHLYGWNETKGMIKSLLLHRIYVFVRCYKRNKHTNDALNQQLEYSLNFLTVAFN